MSMAPAEGDRQATRAAVWARHWASGSPHSCAGSYGATYGGAVAAFWRGVLAEVAPGARTLDLATGAAALPRLFLELAPQHGLAIEAVDLAPAAPAWLEASAIPTSGIRYQGGVSIEALPFADDHFDLVVSQYGLEYAGIAARHEARRVMARQGRAAFVLHHRDARPVQLADVELAHLAWLQAAEGLLPAARDMVEPLARAFTPAGRASLANDRDAQARRERFNAAQGRLASRLDQARDGGDVLQEVRQAVMQILSVARERGDGAVAMTHLAQLETQLQDHSWRLDELRRCALDHDGVAALAQQVAHDHQAPRISTVMEGQHLMGWGVVIGT
ncbi:MAG: class I SAM-dependent methyltransferase [Rhodoferax sp.]|nr:class I SAM-dependent methyltransferase [Rhodoferax sp.]